MIRRSVFFVLIHKQLVCGCLLVCVLTLEATALHAQNQPAQAASDTTAIQHFSAAQDTTLKRLTPATDTTTITFDAVEDAAIATGAEQLEGEVQSLQGLHQDTTAVAEDPIIRLEIDGLVVDETQTRLGRDFYDIFFATWDPPDDAFNFTITIDEQPLPNLGTRVIVAVNEEIAFQANLQPRYDYIEATVEQAIPYVRNTVQTRASRQFIY